jgi:hypothetical protein
MNHPSFNTRETTSIRDSISISSILVSGERATGRNSFFSRVASLHNPNPYAVPFSVPPILFLVTYHSYYTYIYNLHFPLYNTGREYKIFRVSLVYKYILHCS